MSDVKCALNLNSENNILPSSCPLPVSVLMWKTTGGHFFWDSDCQGRERKDLNCANLIWKTGIWGVVFYNHSAFSAHAEISSRTSLDFSSHGAVQK